MPKRQGDVLHFLNVKKVKMETESNNRNKNHCGLSKSKKPNFEYIEQPIIEEKPSCSLKEEIDNLVLPDCWNEKQAFMFTEQYKWLEIKEGKLGCKDCSTVRHLGSKAEKHVHVSKEWIAYLVTPNGSNKTTRQASLRKKIREHDVSKAHGKIQDLLKESVNDSISNLVRKQNNKNIDATIKVFNTVYSLVKHNRPLSDIEGAIELREKNGEVNCLNTRYSATRIAEHIAKEMKMKIFKNIIEENAKICIIIDEASTVSQKKSTLVIYLQCTVQSAPAPVMLFVALKELVSTTAECIFNTLLTTLNDCGFTNEYLKANLIAFCSDGASTMLGRKSGVATKLLEYFPEIIIWNCLNHRLQLSLDDSISEIKQINHFKIFLDKIYSIYHQPNKNQTKLLGTIAKELEIEIIKIGRVMGPRWAACSLQAATAVWRAYPVLYMHFSHSYSGLAKRLANINFLQDLALMIDILEEFSLLSTALQSRSTNIQKAQKLIKRTIRTLENLKIGIGKYESQIEDLIKSDKFKDIPFNKSNKFNALPRNMLLENIIQHMNLRLLSDRNHDESIFNYFDLLEPSTWPYEEITSPWIAGEKKLFHLCEILKYEISLNDFREFVNNNIKSNNVSIPTTIQKAKKIVSTIAINSAEAERGFNLMNIICTRVRNSLTIDHISDLMTINLLGKELADWDATPFVKSWSNCNHRLATDTRVRQKSTKAFYENQLAIWNLQ
ncbi:E3 SUMO-protein ligase KIAA1586 isoform c [Daubentonia madagascariensis]